MQGIPGSLGTLQASGIVVFQALGAPVYDQLPSMNLLLAYPGVVMMEAESAYHSVVALPHSVSPLLIFPTKGKKLNIAFILSCSLVSLVTTGMPGPLPPSS